MALLSKFFGRTASEGAAFALGIATGPVLAPAVESIKNEAWRTDPSRAVDPITAAAIVAEDVEQRAWGAHEAAAHGINSDNFDAITGETLNAPGIGPLFELWRRGLIGDAGFVHGLRKAKMELRWDTPLEGLKETLLASEELANLQQQGFVSAARANAEGGLQGVTEERQQLRFDASGLPPGIVEGLQMLRRGIINDARFAEIVREGHTKTKYTDELLKMRRALLTPHEYEEAALRGILTQAEADAGAALSGLETADAHLLFQIMGRPLTVRAITTGLARGGTFGGTYNDIPEPYRDAVRRSNIRPEYARLAYANRYSFPSAFVLRSLAQSGELGTAAEVETILLEIGWPPDLAAKVAPQWVGGGAAGDPHVAKAQTQLWTATHRDYVKREIGDATAHTQLTTLGIPAADQTQILDLWKAERAMVHAQLSPAQIRKAYKEQVTNPATGAAWTVQDGIDALLARGYSQNDATVFMAE